jgi:hypothetical protein
METSGRLAKTFTRKAQNRTAGISRAAVKLAKEEVESIDEDALKARQEWMKAKGVSTGDPKADRARKVKRLMQTFPMKKEEVESIDEVNARHSPEAAQAVLTPTAKIVRAAVGKTARDKAATKKYARRVANISPDYSKKDVMDQLKSMGEEVEQIDELKKSTLASYVGKAAKALRSPNMSIGMAAGGPDEMRKQIKIVHKREAGITKAAKKLAKEEIEQVDELKKSTIGRYIKKSAEDKAERQSYDDYPDYSRDSEDNERRLNKRTKGIDTAVNKLAKEEVVNEKAPPGAKYERMVKHIKNQYSKDDTLTPKEKAIAYATAWKAKNSGK